VADGRSPLPATGSAAGLGPRHFNIEI